MIGLCGPHRTGKSTLARTVSEMTGLPYIDASVSSSLRKVGLKPDLDYDFETRLEAQKMILTDLAELLSETQGDFVIDRTPLDVYAYLLADIQRDTLTDEQEGAIREFEKDAVLLTNMYYDLIVVVQPGIPLKRSPSSAKPSWAFMNHLNLIMIGMVNVLTSREAMPTTNIIMLREDATSLLERVIFVLAACQELCPHIPINFREEKCFLQ